MPGMQNQLTLRLTRGFPFHWNLQPLVAEFLATCDGTRTAEQAIRGTRSHCERTR